MLVEGHTKKEVCNAISALLWTLAGALDNFTNGSVSIVEEEPTMAVDLLNAPTDQTNMIFETILIGLNQVYENNKEHVYEIVYRMDKEEHSTLIGQHMVIEDETDVTDLATKRK